MKCRTNERKSEIIMKQHITYIGFYDQLINNTEERKYSLAATKKMDYVCDAINELGLSVRIISPAWSKSSKLKYVKTRKVEVTQDKELILCPTWGSKNKITRFLRIIYSLIWLTKWLLINVRENENIIVYHEPWLAIPILVSRLFKKYNLILEIEDYYQEVWKTNFIFRKAEKIIFSKCDECLLVSEVLKEQLNKPEGIVSYGSYTICTNYKKNIDRRNIKLVFTGGIEKIRGGAYLAVETMKYLPYNYSLIISGPSGVEDKEDIIAAIRVINDILGRTACKYVGCLADDKYEELLLNSDIGLNTQKDGDYGSYIFPSKIITYLSHNLRVVSTKGISIVKSQVSELIRFAEGYNPESVAKAIMSIDLTDVYESIPKLEQLDNEFKQKLGRIIVQ
ncbi:hypothetical protein [Clostridium sp.]|uniref:hypothetical protein n=1 Tax=Clostridium sp. TaxID=1506 RepID=UPI00260327C7|nr:hypothetical protein [uncultured Clostridium sp.]